MGIGLCIILPKAYVDKTISIIEKYNMKVHQIGQVDSKGNGNVIGKVENKNYIFS
jgi:phosphoribosylaminoimidazole (AIR) synthetase